MINNDRVGLRGTTGLPGRGVLAVLHKAAFFALVAKKEANCC